MNNLKKKNINYLDIFLFLIFKNNILYKIKKLLNKKYKNYLIFFKLFLRLKNFQNLKVNLELWKF